MDYRKWSDNALNNIVKGISMADGPTETPKSVKSAEKEAEKQIKDVAKEQEDVAAAEKKLHEEKLQKEREMWQAQGAVEKLQKERSEAEKRGADEIVKGGGKAWAEEKAKKDKEDTETLKKKNYAPEVWGDEFEATTVNASPNTKVKKNGKLAYKYPRSLEKKTMVRINYPLEDLKRMSSRMEGETKEAAEKKPKDETFTFGISQERKTPSTRQVQKELKPKGEKGDKLMSGVGSGGDLPDSFNPSGKSGAQLRKRKVQINRSGHASGNAANPDVAYALAKQEDWEEFEKPLAEKMEQIDKQEMTANSRSGQKKIMDDILGQIKGRVSPNTFAELSSMLRHNQSSSTDFDAGDFETAYNKRRGDNPEKIKASILEDVKGKLAKGMLADRFTGRRKDKAFGEKLDSLIKNSRHNYESVYKQLYGIAPNEYTTPEEMEEHGAGTLENYEAGLKDYIKKRTRSFTKNNLYLDKPVTELPEERINEIVDEIFKEKYPNMTISAADAGKATVGDTSSQTFGNNTQGLQYRNFLDTFGSDIYPKAPKGTKKYGELPEAQKALFEMAGYTPEAIEDMTANDTLKWKMNDVMNKQDLYNLVSRIAKNRGAARDKGLTSSLDQQIVDNEVENARKYKRYGNASNVSNLLFDMKPWLTQKGYSLSEGKDLKNLSNLFRDYIKERGVEDYKNDLLWKYGRTGEENGQRVPKWNPIGDPTAGYLYNKNPVSDEEVYEDMYGKYVKPFLDSKGIKIPLNKKGLTLEELQNLSPEDLERYNEDYDENDENDIRNQSWEKQRYLMNLPEQMRNEQQNLDVAKLRAYNNKMDQIYRLSPSDKEKLAELIGEEGEDGIKRLTKGAMIRNSLDIPKEETEEPSVSAEDEQKGEDFDKESFLKDANDRNFGFTTDYLDAISDLGETAFYGTTPEEREEGLAELNEMLDDMVSTNREDVEGVSEELQKKEEERESLRSKLQNLEEHNADPDKIESVKNQIEKNEAAISDLRDTMPQEAGAALEAGKRNKGMPAVDELSDYLRETEDVINEDISEYQQSTGKDGYEPSERGMQAIYALGSGVISSRRLYRRLQKMIPDLESMGQTYASNGETDKAEAYLNTVEKAKAVCDALSRQSVTYSSLLGDIIGTKDADDFLSGAVEERERPDVVKQAREQRLQQEEQRVSERRAAAKDVDSIQQVLDSAYDIGKEGGDWSGFIASEFDPEDPEQRPAFGAAYNILWRTFNNPTVFDENTGEIDTWNAAKVYSMLSRTDNIESTLRQVYGAKGKRPEGLESSAPEAGSTRRKVVIRRNGAPSTSEKPAEKKKVVVKRKGTPSDERIKNIYEGISGGMDF